MKSYGRAPTFLLATGYEQARSVVAMLAGDVAAAERVELVLPETGVCSTDLAAGCRRAAAAVPRRRKPTPVASTMRWRRRKAKSGCGCGTPEPALLQIGSPKREHPRIASLAQAPRRPCRARGLGDRLRSAGQLGRPVLRLQRPAGAAAGRVRCAALAGGRRVFAGTAGFRDRGARGWAARRSRAGPGCDAGRWLARRGRS